MAERQLSEITLYKNVPIRNDYKHLLQWDTPADRDSWFDKFEKKTYPLSSYQRVSQRVRYEGNFEDLWQYNYIKVVNKNDTGTVRNTWYGFIEATIYANDKVSMIDWSEDPWVTNQFKVKLVSANVERAHVRRWRDFDNKEPDVTHFGTEEPVGVSSRTAVRRLDAVDWETNKTDSADVQWLVIVTLPQKGVDGSGDPAITMGTMAGIPSPFSVYVVPFQSNGWTYPWFTSGAGKPASQSDFWNVGGAYMPKLMQLIGTDPKFMKSGQAIVSMYTTPYLGINQFMGAENQNLGLDWTEQYANAGGILAGDNPFFDKYMVQGGSEKDALLHIKYVPTGAVQAKTLDTNVWNWIYEEMGDIIGKESKLLTYPYSALMLEDGKGNNHSFSAYDLPFSGTDYSPALTVMRFGSIGLQQKTAYYISRLGFSQSGPTKYDIRAQNGLRLKNAIIDTDTNSVPIITDNYTSYLVSNQNQITQARNQALNTKNAVEMQNQNSTRNLGIGQGSQMSQLNASQNTARTNNNNLTLAQSGVMKSAKSALNKATRGLTGDLGNMYTTQSEAFMNNMNTEMGNLQTSQQAERDINANNVDVSNRLASNNYELSMAGIQAKLNDVKATGWSLTSAGGNPFFDYMNHNKYVTVSLVTESTDMLRQAKQFFEQFGYTVGTFFGTEALNNLIKGRKRFNYIKTQNIVVTGAIPNHDRDAIQDMFNNGVTIWHDTNPDTLYTRIEDNDEV